MRKRAEMTTGFLTRAQILEADDIHTNPVEIPEWGGRVLVREMTGEERDALEATMAERRGKQVKLKLSNLRARVVALVCVDEDGKPLFTEADAIALGKKNALPLDRIFTIAVRLAGMRDEDVQAFTENFQPGQNGGSTSN